MKHNPNTPYLDNSAGVELTEALKVKIAQFRILGEPVLIEGGKCVWLVEGIPFPVRASVEHAAAEYYYSAAPEYFSVMWNRHPITGEYAQAVIITAPKHKKADNPLKRGGFPDAPGFGGEGQ